MGYCLRDSKDCPVLIEHILLFPCRHTAAFCIFTQEGQRYFTVKDIFGSNQLEVMLFTWVIFIEYASLMSDNFSLFGKNDRL